MYYYRITKYNPKLRDKTGRYLKDEWTDFSCVGSEINGKICTIEEYESTENLYIEAILLLLSCQKINFLECTEIEKTSNVSELKQIPELWRIMYNQIDSRIVIPKEELPILLRLILRSYLWCKLIHGSKMFVHFGWDYYMYVGVEKECKPAIEQIKKTGLFVEKFISPYLSEIVENNRSE